MKRCGDVMPAYGGTLTCEREDGHTDSLHWCGAYAWESPKWDARIALAETDEEACATPIGSDLRASRPSTRT